MHLLRLITQPMLRNFRQYLRMSMINPAVNSIPCPNAKVIFESMLMSDLHLEYGERDLHHFPAMAPCLLLAGDIGRPDVATLQSFLLRQCQRFEHIFYVAGNHCYYDGEYEDRLRQLRALNSLHPRIHFLQRNTFLLPNKVRLLGTTLWSQIPQETALHIGGNHADYRRIEREVNVNGVITRRKLTVADTNEWYAEEHAWLLEEIGKARMKDEHVIIITHHAPSRRDTCLKEDEDLGVEDAYINDLEVHCANPVRLWVYGHTHRSTDMIINSTRVVSNQMGYEGENCGYRKNMKITLFDDGTVQVRDDVSPISEC